MLGLAEASSGAREEGLTNVVVALYKTSMNFGRVAGPYVAVPIIEALGVRGAGHPLWASGNVGMAARRVAEVLLENDRVD